MSSKTTFKRIALVAVAALSLGVLSVAPSSAVQQMDSLTISQIDLKSHEASLSIKIRDSAPNLVEGARRKHFTCMQIDNLLSLSHS